MVRLRRMAPDVYDPTGLAPIGERTLRCIDPSHDEPCQVCCAPPSHGEDSFWSLRGDPGKRNGDKKLRTLIQMTREWNSPLERAHLVHYLQNSPEFSHMGKVIEIVRRKETPRLSKMCMMVLARAWGFKSDIWTRKCFSQPFYQYPNGGEAPKTTPLLKRSASGEASGSETNLLVPSKKAHVAHVSTEIKTEANDAEARWDKLERDILEKFTDHLQQAQTCMTAVVDQTTVACSCCNAMDDKELSTHESHKKYCMASIRNTWDLLLQLKPACEDCLGMLQQAQKYPKEMHEGKPWAYLTHLNQVDKFQSDFEQIFWTGLLSCQPDTYSLSCSKYLQDVAQSVSSFHTAVLKLCSVGKSEIAHARNRTFGEYCTIAVACLKVFYVITIEATAKLTETMNMFDTSPMTSSSCQTIPPPQQQQLVPTLPSPGSYMSTSQNALKVPVLSAEVPTIGNTNSNMPDCLKLLRSLSNEIVLPRSISSEILLPFGLLDSLAQGTGSVPLTQPAQKPQ